MKKLLMKNVSVIILMALLLGYIPEQVINAQEEVQGTYIMPVKNDSYVTMKETGRYRITEYYENGIKLQRTEYNIKTGEIVYYNYADQRYSKDRDWGTKRPEGMRVEKYRIEAFRVKENNYDLDTLKEQSKTQVNSSHGFNYLQSKNFYLGSTFIARDLYGYTGSIQYEQANWAFPANTAVSVIVAVIGAFYSPLVGLIASAVGIVAGNILADLWAKDWIKDSYWKYRVNQVQPTRIEQICSDLFIYKTERRIEINGDTGYWTTTYEKLSAEIAYERDQILTYMTLYR